MTILPYYYNMGPLKRLIGSFIFSLYIGEEEKARGEERLPKLPQSLPLGTSRPGGRSGGQSAKTRVLHFLPSFCPPPERFWSPRKGPPKESILATLWQSSPDRFLAISLESESNPGPSTYLKIASKKDPQKDPPKGGPGPLFGPPKKVTFWTTFWIP